MIHLATPYYLQFAMPSLLARIALFLSSYSPLFVIVGVKAWEDKSNAVAFTAFVLAGVSAAALVLFVFLALRMQANEYTIEKAVSKDSEAMSYVITYLLPFVDPQFSKWTTSLSLGIFFLMIAAVYVRANMIHINPLLSLGGYSIIEVESADGVTMAMITSKRDYRKGDRVMVVRIGDRILLEKPSG